MVHKVTLPGRRAYEARISLELFQGPEGLNGAAQWDMNKVDSHVSIHPPADRRPA